MKKFIMMLVCMFAVHTMVMADNDRPIQVNQLPVKAQTFIKTYFKNHKVALAKMESGVFYKSYDVVFTNGEKVEFDKAGEWKEVRCRQSEVPAQVVPEAIRNYVKTNYPDARILEIEFDHNEYEIKLSNRWEITFDSQMRVIDIDDLQCLPSKHEGLKYKSTKTVVRVNSEQLFLFKSPIYISRQIISSFESK